MNIGYFFWGHLTDKLGEKTKNTPDGNAWYSSSIIYELHKRKHKIYGMSINRDKDDIEQFGIKKCFSSFEQKKRIQAYNIINWVTWLTTYNSLASKWPRLDVLLLEWRFPIFGRNIVKDYYKESWQPDLKMQNILLDYYSKTNTKIIIFDLDYKLTSKDEDNLLKLTNNIVILETAKKPKFYKIKRYTVEIPFWIKNSKIKKSKENLLNKDLVYIGSNYEREETINKYIFPYSKKYPFCVWFYGNWRNYPEVVEKIYCDLKWRDIQYHFRVGHDNFYKIYGDSFVCPLLAKQEYYQNGFMTARIQECLYFGAIPIGFKEHFKIEQYLPKKLIAETDLDVEKIIKYLKSITVKQRNQLRKKLWKHLKFMDVKYFIDKIEELKNE
jgi:hypothetical protein